MRVFLVKRSPNFGTQLFVAQELTGPDQQVVKLQTPAQTSFFHCVENKAADTSADICEGGGCHLADGFVTTFAQLLYRRMHFANIDSPVRCFTGASRFDRPASGRFCETHISRECQLFNIVKGVGQRLLVLRNPTEMHEQFVRRVCAEALKFEHLIEVSDQTRGVDRLGLRRVEIKTLLHQVPVVGQLQGERSEVIEFHAGDFQRQQGRAH